MQLQYRLTDRSKLLGRHLQAIGISACQRRPGLGCRGNAFAGLNQQCGVKSTKLRGVISKRLAAGQPVSRPNGGQHQQLRPFGWDGLGTKKQHVLCEAVRYPFFASGKSRILKNNARGNPFYINVCRAQALRNSLKKGRSNLPEYPSLQTGVPTGQAQADIPHGNGCAGVAGLDNLQHRLVNTRTRFRPISQCFGTW